EHDYVGLALVHHTQRLGPRRGDAEGLEARIPLHETPRHLCDGEIVLDDEDAKSCHRAISSDPVAARWRGRCTAKRAPPSGLSSTATRPPSRSVTRETSVSP